MSLLAWYSACNVARHCRIARRRLLAVPVVPDEARVPGHGAHGFAGFERITLFGHTGSTTSTVKRPAEPRILFGGYKDSSREQGKSAREFFVQMKTV